MFGQGIPQALALTQLPASNFGGPISMPQAAPKKGGMFGSGVGAGDFIQALLAGYLAGQGNPAGAMGMQMINQRRQAKDDEAQYQRHRGDKLADYAEMQKIQAQYGTPHINDTEADYNFWKDRLTPEQFQQYVANKVNPPRLQWVPGLGLVDGSAPQMAAPTAPVGNLTPIDGGPTPQASGGFSGY